MRISHIWPTVTSGCHCPYYKPIQVLSVRTLVFVEVLVQTQVGQCMCLLKIDVCICYSKVTKSACNFDSKNIVYFGCYCWYLLIFSHISGNILIFIFACFYAVWAKLFVKQSHHHAFPNFLKTHIVTVSYYYDHIQVIFVLFFP